MLQRRGFFHSPESKNTRAGSLHFYRVFHTQSPLSHPGLLFLDSLVAPGIGVRPKVEEGGRWVGGREMHKGLREGQRGLIRKPPADIGYVFSNLCTNN